MCCHRHLYIVCFTLLKIIVYVYGDHQLVFREVLVDNSTRRLDIRNGSLAFYWTNIANQSEPEWNFYLNGVHLRIILPHSWRLNRSDTSLTLTYTSQVNYELLSREGAYLTVEAIWREGMAIYIRGIFQQRAIWRLTEAHFCDELSEGEDCGTCSEIAGPDELIGQKCVPADPETYMVYFVKRLLMPTIVGSMAALLQLAMWIFLCVRIRRQDESSDSKPTKADRKDSQETIESLVEKGSKLGLVVSNADLEKKESQARIEDNKNGASKENLTKGSEQSPTEAGDAAATDAKAASEDQNPQVSKPAVLQKDKPMLERIVAHSKRKESSRRFVVANASMRAAGVTSEDNNKSKTELHASETFKTIAGKSVSRGGKAKEP